MARAITILPDGGGKRRVSLFVLFVGLVDKRQHVKVGFTLISRYVKLSRLNFRR
jgi:hypothetical protein